VHSLSQSATNPIICSSNTPPPLPPVAKDGKLFELACFQIFCSVFLFFLFFHRYQTTNLNDRWYPTYTIQGSVLRIFYRQNLWITDEPWWLSLWFRDQSQMSGFNSRHYQIFWVVGLEQGPLSLTSTTEELLGTNSSGSSLEIWEYGRGDPLRWPRHLLSTKVGTNFADKQQLLGRVHLRTKATEFSFSFRSTVSTRANFCIKKAYSFCEQSEIIRLMLECICNTHNKCMQYQPAGSWRQHHATRQLLASAWRRWGYPLLPASVPLHVTSEEATNKTRNLYENNVLLCGTCWVHIHYAPPTTWKQTSEGSQTTRQEKREKSLASCFVKEDTGK
jgi:hypothetical protein